MSCTDTVHWSALGVALTIDFAALCVLGASFALRALYRRELAEVAAMSALLKHYNEMYGVMIQEGKSDV